MSTPPPAGWYPDNAGDGLRFWNGQAWTEHTTPGQGEAAAPVAAGATAPQHWTTPAQTPTAEPANKNWFLRHKILTGVLAVVGLGVVGAALGGGSDDPAPQAGDTSAQSSKEPGTEKAEPEAEREVEPAVEEEPVDTDDDGVPDDEDVQPDNAKVQTEDDIDTDKDGVADYQDAFPQDAKYSKDADGDGVADGLDAFPKDERWSKDSDGDKVADSEDAFPRDPSKSEITLAMENALESAQDYLDYSAFSRLGLIDQLSSEYGEGFSLDDATWAVDSLHVNWNEQAVQSAKDYLDYSAFSRQGLIDQLSSEYGEQFTVAQATYAVNKIGL